MSKFYPGILILAAVNFGTKAYAQFAGSDSTSVPVQPDFSPSITGIIFKLIISMIFIVGLIYFSMYLIKKVNSRATGGGISGETIKVMGRTFISPKQSLYLVKIAQRYAILGATESNINLITELSDDEAKDFDNRERKSATISPGARFSDILKGLTKR